MSASQLHHFSVLPSAQPSPPAPTPAQSSTDPKKRHACPTCGRAFTTSGHLARHIRVHTGERNHKCPFPGCETRCSRQDNLQQHYRIHLSPGSRRTSGARARTETKKKSSLSHSTTSASPTPSADPTATGAGSRSPPDSPPPLARATVLPHPSHLPSQRSGSSTSGSSAGSPRSSYGSSGSPEISRGAGASPFMNVLGLSHERTHSPTVAPTATATTSSYGASYQQQNSVYHQRSNPGDGFPYPGAASPPPTLPPIASLQSSGSSAYAGSGIGALGLARVMPQSQQQQQHPGPYPAFDTLPSHQRSSSHPSNSVFDTQRPPFDRSLSYDRPSFESPHTAPSSGVSHASLAHSSMTQWGNSNTPHDTSFTSAQSTSPWWGGIGVGVTAGRGYTTGF